MATEQLTILKHEYLIKPGEYFHLDLSFVTNPEEVINIIIDQDNVFTKMVTRYPKGFVMSLEQTPDQSIYRSNYPLERVVDRDYFVVKFPEEGVELK